MTSQNCSRALYDQNDYDRQYTDLPEVINEYETPFESDVSRLLLSASFRRLGGKTQLFPSTESDFFRNRLTHSLEVDHIAQIIRRKIKREHGVDINPSVLRFACYAHDLGHPPFGHSGEKKLNELMAGYGGFEGNAQTLRILACLEKGLCNVGDENIRATRRCGLNITFRSLASVLKYNHLLETLEERGYYATEGELVEKINTKVGMKHNNMRTIECSIMDLADDISNAAHDLEDSLKGNFTTPFDLFFPTEEVLTEIINRKNNTKADSNIDMVSEKKKVYNALKSIFESTSLLVDSEEDVISQFSDMHKRALKIGNDGFERSKFVRSLMDKFINGITFVRNTENPALSHVEFDENTRLEIHVLKNFHRIYQHQSSQNEISAYRGGYMIKQIFDAIENNLRLLPEDFYKEYMRLNSQEGDFNKKKKRIICDFISGMTDRYCVEYYGKLFSEDPISYFKPIN